MSRARKQDRFASTLAVSYREPTSSEPSLGTCADISPSGMFIETPRPAARGVLVRFECVSQGSTGVVRGTARVMWLRPHNEAQGKAGMGVRFVRLEPGSARAIEELIAHAGDAGGRTKSDGPEARATTEEPAVVLTAERTIGPSNRSSSVPPKGLRAPTLRGMHPTDLRSSAPPPASGRREAFDSGPPQDVSPPSASGPAPNGEHNEPEAEGAQTAAAAHSHALRERLDRVKRPDETPTGSHRLPGAGEPAETRDGDRVTAPDGSLIDPNRERAPLPANKGLGATMHDSSGAQALNLSASSGPRRGSDTALGVPSPPPPPWKARHSERPPGPGGVEVIRAVHVTADAEAVAAAAAQVPGSGGRAAERPVELADPSELPGAEDPPLSDWEPTISPSRPAMRPDRAPPHVSVPYALPEGTEGLEEVKPGRNWMPWIIIGSGLLVTATMFLAVGRPTAGVPVGDDTAPAEAQEPADDSPLAPENQFLPRKAEAETDQQAIAPKQIIVQLHIEPLGAQVSALGQTVAAPGRLSFPVDMVHWPLRVRVGMSGYGGTEVALPRRVFSASPDGAALVHELYIKLQPVAPPAATGTTAPAAEKAPAEPKPERRSSSSRSHRSSKAEEPAPAPAAAPAPAPAPDEPAPAASAEAKTPFERALECLSRGDNACVLSTLASASGARELDLLIETYRATGDASSAEAAMRRYLELHPDGRRASQYRRALGMTPPSP